jgi:3-methyladenine DNA glycosylase AlkD
MTAQSILKELEPLGSEGYRKILRNHGVEAPCLGVKIEDLKKIQRRVKKDYQLALDLFDTGVYDAMYLAGLIADESRMTKADLRRWAKNAPGASVAGTTVPGVAAASKHGGSLALEWIESPNEQTAAIGWATLACLVSITPDTELDLPELGRLLKRVEKSIHTAPNDVRYQMNAFVIAAGSFVPALTSLALQIGTRIGRVTVDMGQTACQVPFAPDYIAKVQKRGNLGKKRRSAIC